MRQNRPLADLDQVQCMERLHVFGTDLIVNFQGFGKCAKLVNEEFLDKLPASFHNHLMMLSMDCRGQCRVK